MSGAIITADAQPAEDLINQVLVNTEVAMDRIGAVSKESDDIQKKVQTLEFSSKEVFRTVLNTARRTGMVIQGLAYASGNAFANIYANAIQIGLQTAELLIDIATAESFTVVGAFSVAARSGAIMALYVQTEQLRKGQSQAAQRTQGVITVLNALTF